MGCQQRLHRRTPAQRNGVVEAEPKGGTKALEGAHCGGRHGRLGARLDGPGHVWIGFLQCRKAAASVGMEGAYSIGGNVLVHLGANFDLDNRLAGVRGSSNGGGLGTTPGGSPSAFRLLPVGRPRCGRWAPRPAKAAERAHRISTMRLFHSVPRWMASLNNVSPAMYLTGRPLGPGRVLTRPGLTG